MKKISQQQIKGIMALLESYNVGVKDFVLVQKMFNELPVVEEKKEEKKEEAK